MVTLLDEAIAELRAAAGVRQFDLSFVASIEPAAQVREPLLPRPTVREAIEQTLLAARLADSSSERMSLMVVALAAIERDAEKLAERLAHRCEADDGGGASRWSSKPIAPTSR